MFLQFRNYIISFLIVKFVSFFTIFQVIMGVLAASLNSQKFGETAVLFMYLTLLKVFRWWYKCKFQGFPGKQIKMFVIVTGMYTISVYDIISHTLAIYRTNRIFWQLHLFLKFLTLLSLLDIYIAWLSPFMWKWETSQ